MVFVLAIAAVCRVGAAEPFRLDPASVSHSQPVRNARRTFHVTAGDRPANPLRFAAQSITESWTGPTTAAAPAESHEAWTAEASSGPLHDGSLLLRHVGRGQPLVGTSWLNRPLHAGWLIGSLWGDELVSNSIDQTDGMIGGYRIGRDFDHFWGGESRFAFTRQGLVDMQGAPLGGISRRLFFDAHLMHYPWGDARWRPFLAAGVGVSHVRFSDPAGRPVHVSQLQLPIGLGVKILARNWLAYRLDLWDDITLAGSGVDAMHSLSVSFGVEVHYGGEHVSYYPWHTGIDRR